MTTYQIAVRNTVASLPGIGELYEKFLAWWASLYVEVPPRPYL